MFILGKRNVNIPTVLAILVVLASKSSSHERYYIKNDESEKATIEPVVDKAQSEKSDEKSPEYFEPEADDGNKGNPGETGENGGLALEGKNGEKTFGENNAETTLAEKIAENPSSNRPKGRIDENMQRPSPLQEQEQDKQEVFEPQKLTEETKKRRENPEDNIRKISLSDVNSVTSDDAGGHTEQVKRDVKDSKFLGVPRDSSYFFDDLEPFITNGGQENARAVRAIPTRENKFAKPKVGGKKVMVSDEAEEEEGDEDDNENLEEDREKDEEKESDEYYDDENDDAECQPTPECTTSPECTTTECTTTPECTTTTKCTTKATTCTRKTTTKCTTKPTCTTAKCTTEACPKTPKMCGKGNDKRGHYSVPEKAKSWDFKEDRRKRKKIHRPIKDDN